MDEKFYSKIRRRVTKASVLEFQHAKEVLAKRRIFSLVDMMTNTQFSNFPNVLKNGVVWQ